ncbi:hypothetical protein CHS0354_012482 [Potamilus streckersoni]|uniref:Ankyrin repeat domain-containing protein n=1 Tax=Potamilus streckersoni TaxID=2493646 RepID=A0AAE0VN64_9BIVA|nr:hypothetical protein CHS0354_012482 [Potamilus streckersoni]
MHLKKKSPAPGMIKKSQSSHNLRATPSVLANFRKLKRTESSNSIASMGSTVNCPASGDVNARDTYGRSLLSYAARYEQIDTAKELLKSGCNPNAADETGKTPLHEAVEKGSLEIVKILIKDGGADVNVRTRRGQTPMMIAVTMGHLEIVKTLHKLGASLNCRDQEGRTSVLLAVNLGRDDIFKYLLEQPCNINAVDNDGNSVFYFAMHSEKIASPEMAKKFLKTDYDFKKDAEWLALENSCTCIREDQKLFHKILEKAGLKYPNKKISFLERGKAKLVRTVSRLSLT